MTKKRPTKKAVKGVVPSGFSTLLGEIKLRIQSSQTRAMTAAVNAELVRLYWDIGRKIDQRQQAEGWGTGVIPRLAAELRNELPEVKGFSERNIKSMLAFFRDYPRPEEFVQQAVAQLRPSQLSPQAVAKSAQSAKMPQTATQLTTLEKSAAGCCTIGEVLKSAAACGAIGGAVAIVASPVGTSRFADG